MMKRFFARMVPAPKRELAMDVLADIDAVIGGFVRGQLIVAAVVAAMAIVALTMLRIPFALLIGVWAGIADIIPYIGPFAGGIPAVLVALFTGGWPAALGVLVAFTIINQIEAHLLGPRIVSSTVKVTPLAIIFALLIGVHVFGFLGLLIAVPVAGIVRVVLCRIFPDEEITNAELRPGLTQMPLAEVDPEATRSREIVTPGARAWYRSGCMPARATPVERAIDALQKLPVGDVAAREHVRTVRSTRRGRERR